MRLRRMLWTLMLLAACAPRLVQETSPERPRWDVPFGKPFPEGTRGLVVARDTLWVGPLVARKGGLQVANRTFPLSEVDCVAYRLPPSYLPWQIGFQSGVTMALGMGVTIGALAGLMTPGSCESEPAPVDSSADSLFDPLFDSMGAALIGGLALGCGIADAIAVVILSPVLEVGVLMTLWGYRYPELRLRKALHRYALRRDPVWRDRCAEILHFYHPLLEEDPNVLLLRKGRDFQVIPLDF